MLKNNVKKYVCNCFLFRRRNKLFEGVGRRQTRSKNSDRTHKMRKERSLCVFHRIYQHSTASQRKRTSDYLKKSPVI